MKRVIVAVQNTLVSEVILSALKRRGMLAEKSLSGEPQKVADMCETLFADVLVMDVACFGSGTFDNRTATAEAVRRRTPNAKICFVCDNVSNDELAVKVANAKDGSDRCILLSVRTVQLHCRCNKGSVTEPDRRSNQGFTPENGLR